MGLPAENWDIASFDGVTETELNADWTDTYPSEPTFIGGALHFVGGETGMLVSATSALGATTAAVEVQLVDGDAVSNACGLFGYVLSAAGTTLMWYLICSALGTYTTPDGVAFEQLDTTDYIGAPHKAYIVIDTITGTADFYVDGEIISEGYELYDSGIDFEFESSLVQCGLDTEADVFWMGFSTETILPESEGPVTATEFTLGAAGVVFKIDEYAQYNSLTADQILTHYKAGRGIPQ